MQALLYKKYSTASDVWSYGMVNNSQVLQFLQKGYCQAPPPGCPEAIYQIMIECWLVHRKDDSCINEVQIILSETKLIYRIRSDPSSH